MTIDGEGRVHSLNPAKKTATVVLEDGQSKNYPWEELVEKE